MKICFIGGGNMATALSGGIIAKGASPESIAIVELLAEARERIAARFGVTTYERYDSEAIAADVIVFAVKPQKMREAAQALAPLLSQQLVISIAAGIRVADLSRWLNGYRKLVRAMPNTPALIGEGISALYAPLEVEAGDRHTAESILAAAGDTLWVANEDLIDAVTVLSGSGPAYVFYFMEALQQAAEKLGFNEADARKLALKTFRGASLLAAQSDEAPAQLRVRVTSKAGTTEAAVAVMDKAGLQQIMIAAVEAGNRRSRELGDLLGKD
jgi:pyrroline-5-carboxylate reductase